MSEIQNLYLSIIFILHPSQMCQDTEAKILPAVPSEGEALRSWGAVLN